MTFREGSPLSSQFTADRKAVDIGSILTPELLNKYQRTVSFVVVERGGNPGMGYTLLCHKTSKDWWECLGGELEQPDMEALRAEAHKQLDLLQEGFQEAHARLLNGRPRNALSSDEKLQLYLLHEQHDLEVESILDRQFESRLLGNLLREVSEEAGLSDLPHCVSRFSDTSNQVAGRIQHQYKVTYRLNKLPVIKRRDEHDQGIWIQWPFWRSNPEARVSDLRGFVDSMVKERALYVIPEQGRQDVVVPAITRDQRDEARLSGFRVISPLSDVTLDTIVSAIVETLPKR